MTGPAMLRKRRAATLTTAVRVVLVLVWVLGAGMIGHAGAPTVRASHDLPEGTQTRVIADGGGGACVDTVNPVLWSIESSSDGHLGHISGNHPDGYTYDGCRITNFGDVINLGMVDEEHGGQWPYNEAGVPGTPVGGEIRIKYEAEQYWAPGNCVLAIKFREYGDESTASYINIDSTGGTWKATLSGDVTFTIPGGTRLIAFQATDLCDFSHLWIGTTTDGTDPTHPDEEDPGGGDPEPCDWEPGEEAMDLVDCILTSEPDFDCETPDEVWDVLNWLGWVGCIIVEHIVWMANAIVRFLGWMLSVLALIVDTLDTIGNLIAGAVWDALTWLGETFLAPLFGALDAIADLLGPGEATQLAWDALVDEAESREPFATFMALTAAVGTALGAPAAPVDLDGYEIAGVAVPVGDGLNGALAAVAPWRTVLWGGVLIWFAGRFLAVLASAVGISTGRRGGDGDDD